MKSVTPLAALAVFFLALSIAPFEPAFGEEAEAIEEVVVTGSRIRRDPLNEPTAVMELGRDDLVNTGVTNLGDALQNLPITGSAPNSHSTFPATRAFPRTGRVSGPGPCNCRCAT